MSRDYELVAHRGQALSFPENSLEGYRHALKAGARFVETDINFTADPIPVLSHDADLMRISGQPMVLAEHHYQDIKAISAGYPDRFGEQFSHCRIATLAEFCELLGQWPEVTAFIELKEESIAHLGSPAVDLTCEALQSIATQAVLISYDYHALVYAKQHHDYPIGWVLPEWSEQNHEKAIKLAPDYLFVDSDFCPQHPSAFWPGNWRWAVYTINDAAEVALYAALGITLIETDRFSELVDER